MKLGKLINMDLGSSINQDLNKHKLSTSHQMSHEIFFLWFEIYGGYDKILNPERQ